MIQNDDDLSKDPPPPQKMTGFQIKLLKNFQKSLPIKARCSAELENAAYGVC
jgi:hypothetical protein